MDGVDDERADLLFGDRSKKPPTNSIGTHSVAYCILLLVTVLTSSEFAAAISLSSSSTIYKRLLSMHSKSHALRHDNMIIVGGWIMIIVETQLHSGNLESSQRNLEEVPRTQSNAVQ